MDRDNKGTSENDPKWKKKPFTKDVNLLRGLVKTMVIDGRVTSAAFKDSECSVDRDDLKKPEETIESNNNFLGIGQIHHEFPASLNDHHPIEFKQEVTHTPNLTNLAHCTIKGKKSPAIARKLARASILILAKEKPSIKRINPSN